MRMKVKSSFPLIRINQCVTNQLFCLLFLENHDNGSHGYYLQLEIENLGIEQFPNAQK